MYVSICEINMFKPSQCHNAIFDLDYPFLYHMFIFFAIAYIYDGVLYDCTSRFHRVFLPTNNLGNPSYKKSEIHFFYI